MRAVAVDEVGEPRITTHPTTGTVYHISTFLGEVSAEDGKGAQGFLVECPNPRSMLLPHWHRVDQFQIVVAGGGKVGAHEVAPVGIHYADAYTTYGPIQADEEGISFFTLRAEHTAKSYYMPDSKSLLPRKRGREISAHVPVNANGFAGQAEDRIVEALIEPQADGLFASVISLKPRAAGAGLAPQDGNGQYYVVVEGSLDRDGKAMSPRSLIFVSPDEEAPKLVAGDAGAKVLCLQLPRKSD